MISTALANTAAARSRSCNKDTRKNHGRSRWSFVLRDKRKNTFWSGCEGAVLLRSKQSAPRRRWQRPCAHANTWNRCWPHNLPRPSSHRNNQLRYTLSITHLDSERTAMYVRHGLRGGVYTCLMSALGCLSHSTTVSWRLYPLSVWYNSSSSCTRKGSSMVGTRWRRRTEVVAAVMM